MFSTQLSLTYLYFFTELLTKNYLIFTTYWKLASYNLQKLIVCYWKLMTLKLKSMHSFWKKGASWNVIQRTFKEKLLPIEIFVNLFQTVNNWREEDLLFVIDHIRGISWSSKYGEHSLFLPINATVFFGYPIHKVNHHRWF